MRISFKTTLAITTAGIVILFAVWVIPIPFSMAEWFVDQHYDYFIKPKEIVNKEYSGIKRIFMGVSELKLRSDWRRQFVKRIQPEINSEVDAFQIVPQKFDNLMISGLEFPHKPIDQTTFATLIRGYGWCDQINGAFAFTLHGLMDGVEVYALADPETGVSPHTIARINSASLGVVYIDAFLWRIAIRYFGVEDTLTEKGKQVIPLLRDILHNNKDKEAPEIPFEARFYQSGFVLNKFNFSYQFKKALSRFWDAISSIDLLFNKTVEADILVDWMSKEADEADTLHLSAQPSQSRSGQRINEATIEQQKTFVKARLYHLYGNGIIAKKLYKTLMECENDICKVSRIFYKRLSNAN
jgi:hypothetical protein